MRCTTGTGRSTALHNPWEIGGFTTRGQQVPVLAPRLVGTGSAGSFRQEPTSEAPVAQVGRRWHPQSATHSKSPRNVARIPTYTIPPWWFDSFSLRTPTATLPRLAANYDISPRAHKPSSLQTIVQIARKPPGCPSPGFRCWKNPLVRVLAFFESKLPCRLDPGRILPSAGLAPGSFLPFSTELNLRNQQIPAISVVPCPGILQPSTLIFT
jgi:hypothetical protein